MWLFPAYACYLSKVGSGTSDGNPLHLPCLLQKMMCRFLYLKRFMILSFLIKYVYPNWGYLLDCKWSFLVLNISVWLMIFYHVNIYETIIAFFQYVNDYWPHIKWTQSNTVFDFAAHVSFLTVLFGHDYKYNKKNTKQWHDLGDRLFHNCFHLFFKKICLVYLQIWDIYNNS